MEIKIDKNKSVIEIQNWVYGDIPILELKRWIDTQIENGKNKITLDINWGFYNDIDSIDLNAEE